MKAEMLTDNLRTADQAMIRNKEKELVGLSMPEQEEFQGNDQLYRQAMEEYLAKRNIIQSELDHLKSAQRQIARADSGSRFGIN